MNTSDGGSTVAYARRTLGVIAVVALAALITATSAGCDDVGSVISLGGATSTNPAGEKVSLQLDEASAETKTITAEQGAAFATASGEATAAVIIMPGTFPDGTDVTFTPLASEEGVLPGFDITAEGDAQPSLPVFVVYETAEAIPEDQTIVAYGEDSDEGVMLYTTASSEEGANYLLAEVTHFTVYRVDGIPPKGRKPTDKNNGYQSGFKQWAIKVDDTLPVDDGMWLGELRFEMDVRSPAGDIMGPYNGQGSYAVDLGMSEDVGVLAGSAQGAWVGPMNFSPCSVKKFHFSYTPTEGGIKPGLGFWLSAEGDFTPTEVTPFEVSLGSDVFSGTADLSPFAPGLVPMTLFISESGATIEIADHQFKGFVIGTLAEEPSE